MMKNQTLLLLILLIPFISYSKDYADKSFYLIDSLELSKLEKHDRTLLDSVLNIYHKTDEDSIKFEMLSVVSEELYDLVWIRYNRYLKSKLERAIEQEKDSVKIIQYENKYAACLNNIGVEFWLKGDILNAKENYESALKIQQKNKDKISAAWTLNNIAQFNEKLGNIILALDQYHEILRIQIEHKDYEGMGNSYLNIANIYGFQESNEKEEEYIHHAFDAYNKVDNQEGIARSLSRLGVYLSRNGDLATAREKFLEANLLYTQMNDAYGIIQSQLNLAELMEPDKEKEQLLLETLELADEVKIPELQNYVNQALGTYYYEKGALKKAKIHAEEALRLAEQLNRPLNKNSAAKLCSNIYRDLNNYEQAYKLLVLHQEMKDSIKNKENLKAAVKSQYKYEYDQKHFMDSLEFAKQQEIKNLEISNQESNISRQRIALGAAAGGVILLLLLAFSIRNGKKRSDELLLNILPEEVAEELKHKGEAEAKLFENTTILFTDFKSFTSISETMSPKVLVANIHEAFSEFDNIIQKHNIEKIKTVGDAYLAVGGLPVPNQTHATDVMKAAIEIRDCVETIKQKKIKQGLPYFEVRIGIHSGPVVAGIVGIKKFSYDVWGDSVNTASRMESNGEVGKINISQTTYDYLKENPQLKFEHRGKIDAKGKGKIDMYFVDRV